MPTFLGIGVQRGGTTWIATCLREHPDVFLPQRKELRFFNFEYDKGIGHYQSFFAEHLGQRAVGEITPSYYQNEPLKRIRQHLPDGKLFIVLRNPIDRAFSQYQLNIAKNEISAEDSFRDACEKYDLIERGMYAKHLKRIRNVVPDEQLHVSFYDDLCDTPKQFIAEIYEFIGVDPSFEPPSLAKRYNRIVLEGTQRRLAQMKLTWAVELVKRTPLGEWIKNRHTRSGPQIDSKDAAWLREIFRDDVLELQQMCDRDLCTWLT